MFLSLWEFLNKAESCNFKHWENLSQGACVCHLFFIYNLKRILSVPSLTVNSVVYFDVRQLSIAKLVEDSTLRFLCKLKTYEMNFNILQSLLLLN